MSLPYIDPENETEREYALRLMRLLEEKTGAGVWPVWEDHEPVALTLVANGRVICAVADDDDTPLSETVDILGYLFFYVWGHSEGEA